MTNHLSEEEIQQYALDGEHCSEHIVAHIQLCAHCRVQANNYRLVFKEVSRMPAPAVEADITELVMSKLNHRPARLVRGRKDRSLGYLLAGGGVLVLIVCWLCNSPILNIRGDIPGTILYLLAGVSLSIAVVRALGMVTQYRRQLKSLDLF